MNKNIGIFLARLITVTALGSAYVGASLFFVDSFYFGSSIGGLDIGGYSVEAAKTAVMQRGEHTALSIYGRGTDKQVVKGSDIHLTYEIKEDLGALKKEQPAFLWPMALVAEHNIKVTQSITYDEQLLSQAIGRLSYFQQENIVPPTDAEIVFDGTEYVIVPEEQGRMLNKEAVYKAVTKALSEDRTVIDLEEEGCYEKPRITQDSPEITLARQLINESLYTQITYLLGDAEESVTPEMLSSWMKLNDQQEIEVDRKQVEDYIGQLAQKYDTHGIERSFVTAKGENITVSGGDYGWSIDQKAEADALIEAIKNRERIYREPIADKNGAASYVSTELGNSYVEISLTEQHLWLYKNGKLIVEGDVVTGDKNRGYGTPQGTYKLDYKQRNAILRGPGYATPVSFWMPFNGGIGIHDAVWRGRFGGKIYVNNGSHGCVNVPYDLAKSVFENINESMPIICHY